MLLNKFGKAKTFLGAKAPTILFGVGIVSAIGSVASAIAATLEIEKDIDEWRKDREAADEVIVEKYKEPGVTEEEAKDFEKKANFVVTWKFIKRLIRRYALTAGLLTLSVVTLTGSHYILNDALVKTGAALTAATQSQQLMEKRILEDPEGGEDKLAEYKYGLKKAKEAPQYDEAGNPLNADEVFWSSEDNPTAVFSASPYAREFYDLNPNFDSSDPVAPITFIRQVEDTANWRLARDGHLYLNEVYRLLGIDPERWSKAGQDVGWIHEQRTLPDGRKTAGFVKISATPFKYKVDGRLYPAYMLDFNVDGYITDSLFRLKF